MNHAVKGKKVLYVILASLLLGLLICSCVKICAYQKDLRDESREMEEIIEKAGIVKRAADTDGRTEHREEGELPAGAGQIDFEALRDMNEEITGWIICNDDIINYPVVQAKDNEYYLEHSFMNKENCVGSIFMDYRNASFEDKNVVIYGHNTINRTMFGSLKDFLKNDFRDEEERSKIYLIDTENCLRIYQIFSYYVVESEEYYITTSFENDEEYSRFLDTIRNRSFGECNVEVTKEDKILTLSTCYGAAGTGKRLVIHAKKLDAYPESPSAP